MDAVGKGVIVAVGLLFSLALIAIAVSMSWQEIRFAMYNQEARGIIIDQHFTP